MPTRTLLQKLVTTTTYVYANSENSRAYVAASPVSGTVLAETTAAPKEKVQAVEAGGTDATVLWEPWTAGASATAAYGIVDAPWTAIRITATNANVNVSGD